MAIRIDSLILQVLIFSSVKLQDLQKTLLVLFIHLTREVTSNMWKGALTAFFWGELNGLAGPSHVGSSVTVHIVSEMKSMGKPRMNATCQNCNPIYKVTLLRYHLSQHMGSDFKICNSSIYYLKDAIKGSY